jgi:hypothetical protein
MRIAAGSKAQDARRIADRGAEIMRMGSSKSEFFKNGR